LFIIKWDRHFDSPFFDYSLLSLKLVKTATYEEKIICILSL